MRLSQLIEAVTESKENNLDAEVLEYTEELFKKGFSKKDVKSKLKKEFSDISKSDIEIIINLF